MQVSTKSFVAGAAAMLVLGTGSAVAATGGKLILGHSNSASTTTTIKDKHSTPLALDGPRSKPPLKVNSSKKVARLNADTLDGVDSTRFALKAGGTGERWSTAKPVLQDINGDGTNDVAQFYTHCPAGAVATGVTESNWHNIAIIDTELWDANHDGIDDAASSYTTALNATESDYNVGVICYNPRGKVASGGSARPAATTRARAVAAISVQTRARLAASAAAAR